VSAAYFRTWWQNFTVPDNQAVAPADFDEFCVTAPTDSRLPGGGGNRICGFYDVKPAKFGQVDNLEVQYDNFGGRSQVYDGVEFSLAARYGRGGVLNAGVSFGQTVDDQCNAPDLTVTLLGAQVPRAHCRSTQPFSSQAQVKVNGAYPLPWGLQSSFTLQNLPGMPVQASFLAQNAHVADSLGRPLNAGFALVELIEPNTVFEPRYTVLDLRFSRAMRFGRTRVQPRFDVYNVLNASAVIAMLTRYGSAWLLPNDIYQGRMYKFGIQVDF
jgi:hypothetical protein